MTNIDTEPVWMTHAEADFGHFHSRVMSGQKGPKTLYAYLIHDDTADTCEPPEIGDYRVKEHENGRTYRVYISQDESDLDKFRKMHRAAVTTWTDLYMPGADNIEHAGELYTRNCEPL